MDRALGSGRPAGFVIRAVAAALDLLLVMLVRGSYALVAARAVRLDPEGDSPGALVAAFTLLFALVYASVLHGGVGGQTVGKMLVGIRVVAADGGSVGLGPAVLRTVTYVLSALPLGLGFFMAGLRGDARALHDLMAGTRVEHVSRCPERESSRLPASGAV